MSAFIKMVANPAATALANEMRATWRQIERLPPNDLRIAVFYEQMEAYLYLFGTPDGDGERWDRRSCP